MSEDMVELLSCAHCGAGSGRLGVREAPFGSWPHWWQAYCSACSMETGRIISKAGAIAVWNRRSPLPHDVAALSQFPDLGEEA